MKKFNIRRVVKAICSVGMVGGYTMLIASINALTDLYPPSPLVVQGLIAIWVISISYALGRAKKGRNGGWDK